MKNILCVLILLSWAGAGLSAQEPPPPELLHAAQCLAAKGMLPDLKTPVRSFGYTTDTESYPGYRVQYVVLFKGKADDGWVFAVFQPGKGGNDVFSIKNNARFVWSKSGDDGVDFIDSPLGGEWTKEHLSEAIKKIKSQPRFEMSAKDLHEAPAMIRCESYMDNLASQR